MKISELRRYALSLCAAAILPAGCGGSQVAGLSSTQQFALGRVRPDSSSNNEVLSGTDVRVRIQTCVSDFKSATFSAKGSATGPYPGHFTAQGRFLFQAVFGSQWNVSESFAIKSGKSTVSGTINGSGNGRGAVKCDRLGPSLAQYTSNIASGNAHVKIIRQDKLRETLYGL